MNIITLAGLTVALSNKLELRNTVERVIDHKTMAYLAEAVYSVNHNRLDQVAYNRKQAMRLHGKGLKSALVVVLAKLQKVDDYLGNGV